MSTQTVNLQIPKKFEFLFHPSRYKVAYGGRGGGKSQAVAMALLAQGMGKKLRILCARELQVSIADSVHRLLSDLIRNNGLEHFYEILQTTIRGKNGTEFLFKGLKHNITEIKGFEGVDRVWCEEAENISEKSWEMLIPTIRKPNSEIWVTFNPKNLTDPTYRRFISEPADDVVSHKISWRDNPFFPDVLNKERLKLLASDPESAAHIWEGEVDTRRSGAVFAKQLTKAREEGRITRVPYDPSCEVFTAWDLGFGDATAIWWLQFVGRELRWLEYYENSGEQLDHYVQVIKAKPYNYMKMGHFLPHDGGHGNIRGENVTGQLLKMGVPNQVLPREQDINPGIELLRQTIAFSCFDQKACADGIHALENYGYEWDEDRGIFKAKPRHDWASHGASAARYAALAAARQKAGLGKSPVSFAISGKTSWAG